jgi:catechol 2,3-dioxygenase
MSTTIHPDARIGHVHLRVADLDRATGFYRDLLGLDVVAGLNGVAFLAAGDYHHHVALNTWHSQGGTAPSPGSTGLHHFAILLPDREALADVVGRLLAARYPVDGAEDHGATVAVYVRDPDGNGVELSYDRPRDAWFDQDGEPIMKAESFDPLELLIGWSEPVPYGRMNGA